MFTWIRRVYDWMGTKVHSPYALMWLSFLFFIEASVFFIPVDPLLILFCVENSKRAFNYAAISTAASVIGGCFGYLIGYALWESVGSLIVQYIISEKTFNGIVEQYRQYQTIAVLVAGFTPVPYKAVTISAGFCKLPFLPFVGYSIIARAARFFLVAGAIKVWGERIKSAIDRFFNYLVIAFIAIVVLSFSVLKGNAMLQLPMPKIKEIEALAKAKPGCLSFSQGALKIGGVDQQVKEYARQMLTLDKADYYGAPLGLIELRKKIAEDLTKEHGVRVGIENVAISHGAVGALTALGLTLLKDGDEVILPEPAYPVYNSIVALSKAQSVFVKAGRMERKEKDLTWSFDIQAIEEAITPATRMIIIANPSNPTGSFLSKQEIITLQKMCESRGIYLVMDEVYDNYVFEGTFVSASAYAVKSNFVIRVGSFSKSFGMSGWRVGYLVASPHLILSMAPVQAATLSCPTIISQHAALYALEHKHDILPGYYEAMVKSRELACNFFDKLAERGLIEYVKPPAGFYIFFKTKEADSMDLVFDIMSSVGVAMAPGSDFGESCNSFIRFCFARDADVIRQGIERLQSYFSAQQIASYKQPMAQGL